jgi:hypothetical protein
VLVSPSGSDAIANNMNFISKHTVAGQGQHILKIWMSDPGIVLDKFVLTTTGVKPSYLGPPESFANQSNTVRIKANAAAPERKNLATVSVMGRQIILSIPSRGEYGFRFFDTNGKILHSETMHGSGKHAVSATPFGNGTYLYRISSGGKIQNGRLVLF